MAITPADVKRAYPQTAGVDDAVMASYIGEWASRFSLANKGAVENAAVDSGVLMGAAARALAALWSGQSPDEPGIAKSLREGAEALVKTVDEQTTSEAEQATEAPIAYVERAPW